MADPKKKDDKEELTIGARLRRMVDLSSLLIGDRNKKAGEDIEKKNKNTRARIAAATDD
jgi:hypothetical protein